MNIVPNWTFNGSNLVSRLQHDKVERDNNAGYLLTHGRSTESQLNLPGKYQSIIFFKYLFIYFTDGDTVY